MLVVGIHFTLLFRALSKLTINLLKIGFAKYRNMTSYWLMWRQIENALHNKGNDEGSHDGKPNIRLALRERKCKKMRASALRSKHQGIQAVIFYIKNKYSYTTLLDKSINHFIFRQKRGVDEKSRQLLLTRAKVQEKVT